MRRGHVEGVTYCVEVARVCGHAQRLSCMYVYIHIYIHTYSLTHSVSLSLSLTHSLTHTCMYVWVHIHEDVYIHTACECLSWVGING